VPGELAVAFEALGNSNPAFAWQSPVDVTLTVNGELPIAHWVYAVAAPFRTLQDDISLADLHALWQAGGLVLDAETAAVLRGWWGEPETAATIIPTAELINALWDRQSGYDTPVLTILPFEQLEPRLKVLRVDGLAPIDMDFDPATYPLTIPFGLSGEQAAVVQAAWSGPATNWEDGRITHIVMSGPAGMRRAVADRMERYGLQYPAEVTGPILQMADIAHMSNEDPFATDCPPADPYNSDRGCNRAEYFELMTWMGIDVNEMTGNHLNDWGTAALQYTFDLYEANGIQWFGGGRDLEDAARPLLIEHNGNKIAFIGCNPVGPEYGWATADRPGAMPCNDYSDIQAQIRQLADDGYLVIATLQYLEDYQYAVLAAQRQAFQGLAEAGATAVSGSHGHHPQGFSFHNGAFIHYGIGNLLADQMWSLGTRQTFLDVYTVLDGRLLNVDLWTGLNEDYARIRQMTAEERQALLQAVFEASDW
jgi:poly-gamma-glutamate synthesis protein (capsule biosynthesis protein)